MKADWTDIAVQIFITCFIAGVIGALVFGSIGLWSTYGTGPCAWRGGVDSTRSLYTPGKTVCANGEIR